jgi:hypothetical protein
MSCVLTPFLIDLSALRKAVGSRDESLIAAAMKKNPRLFESDFSDFDGIPISLALRHLVMGESLDDQCGPQYGYALESLCDHLGARILPNSWGGVRWVALSDSGVEEVLMRSGSPIPLPDLQGAMTIGHLTADEVAAELSKLGGADSPPVDDEDLQELIDEYHGWLRTAASTNKDVVLIYR